MKRSSRDRKKLVIFMLMSSIACLSIGFAAFSTTLNISSSASVNPNSDNFKVKFSTNQNSLVVEPVVPSAKSDDVIASNAVINNTLTPSISNISVSFSNPGQYAKYTVYVRNEGTYHAYLNNIIFSGEHQCEAIGESSPSLVAAACDYINVSVSIGPNSYSNSTELNHYVIPKNTSEKITINVDYYNDGPMGDGDFKVTFPEIALIFSTVGQPETPTTLMGVDDVSGTLNSKIKEDSLFKGPDENVDFSAKFTTGVYVKSGTENNVNPIYYYRGAVDNNNVLFADKCWLIVRTTETGGTKLIYNGTPTSDNKCNGEDSIIGNSTYNDKNSSIEDLNYIHIDGTNSTIKQVVDTWYTSNMTSYTNYLEDTVWCNNRRVAYNGYYEALETNATVFSGYMTNVQNNQPTLFCSAEDSLTLSATNQENKLTYPIGLLTADELTLAGMGWNSYKTTVYLNNNYWWWTMTAYTYEKKVSRVFGSFTGGGLDRSAVAGEHSVRPAVSLKPGAYVSTGDGTASSPYVIE